MVIMPWKVSILHFGSMAIWIGTAMLPQSALIMTMQIGILRNFTHIVQKFMYDA